MTQFFALFVHEAPALIGRLLVQQKEDPQQYSYKLADDAVEKVRPGEKKIYYCVLRVCLIHHLFLGLFLTS